MVADQVFQRTSTELTKELSPTTPAITTISVCPTCPPISVTRTTQPITSWCSSSTTPTATTCITGGICEFYIVKDSECPTVIEYNAPCETGYVCPYDQCWAVMPVQRVSNKFLFSSTLMELRLTVLGKIGIAMYIY